MKRALAIICSLMLLWTQAIPAARLSSDGPGIVDCCCDCAHTSCCAVSPSSGSQPVSTAPAPSTSQTQLFLPATFTAWTLPDVRSVEFASHFASFSSTADAPLYARICVRLI